MICIFKKSIFFIVFANLLQASPNPTIQEIFTKEHLTPLYSTSSKSPLPCLLELRKKLSFSSVIDAGCGTSHLLFQEDLPFGYVGIDIVESIIKKNKTTHDKYSFLLLDITKEKIPSSDLILCQNCLEYLSFFDAYNALNSFKESGASYLLTSTYSDQKINKETSTGVYRKLNLRAYPFYFPPPLFTYDLQEGKQLELWRLQDLDLTELLNILSPPLTVLSKPVGKPLFWEHPAVVNSIKRGLSQIHQNFSVNPDTLDRVKQNVFVVCDPEAGRNAYQWKLENKIKRLVIGPNMVGSPFQENKFVSWPLIDAYLHPSEWTRKGFIAALPLLEGRISLWPAGVDEQYWNPVESFEKKRSNKVLLYRKTDFNVCDQIETLLKNLGFEVVSITYGKYSIDQYKQICNQCKFAVFISRSESQGIALAESWSMDVPTLVWNPKGSITYQEVIFNDVSSAPYLSEMTGKEWTTEDDLTKILKNFNSHAKYFQPRRWTLLHMTDKVSSEQLLSYIRQDP
jgi:hypothetical protein